MGDTAYWRVVGGGDAGGIRVRAGQAFTSEQLEQRLSHGAVVRQLALREGRLHFARVSGTGPASGWVSVTLKDKQLLEPCEEDAARAPPPKLAPAGARRPRVAFLHGEPGSAPLLSLQLEHLMAKGRKDIDFVGIEGPLEVPADNPDRQVLESMFSAVLPGAKYLSYGTPTYDSKGWFSYEKPRESLDYLQAELEKQGPFDGVLGFSGGSHFALMLAAMGAAGAGKPIGFVVLLSPPSPGFVEELPEFFRQKLPVPVFLTRGKQETYAADLEEEEYQKRLSEKGVALDKCGETVPSDHVVKLLADPEVVTHSGGHIPIPMEEVAALSGRILRFILDRSKWS